MKMNRVLLIILALMFCNSFIQAQDVSRLQILREKENPALSVNYSQVVEFKIASNKTTYRIGDIIKITYAMLNKSENDVFLSDFEPEITLIDSGGKKFLLEKHFIVDYKVTSDTEIREKCVLKLSHEKT